MVFFCLNCYLYRSLYYLFILSSCLCVLSLPVLDVQSTSRDLELAPKPSGSGGSVGGGSRGSHNDLGTFTNGSAGGSDSPTQSGGAAAAISTPPAHPSRDILEEVLSKPGPYPMVRIDKKKNNLKNRKGNSYYFIKKYKSQPGERKPSTW